MTKCKKLLDRNIQTLLSYTITTYPLGGITKFRLEPLCEKL